MEKEQKQELGLEGICITHSCIPLYTVYMQHIMAHSGWWNAGMGNTDIYPPSQFLFLFFFHPYIRNIFE